MNRRAVILYLNNSLRTPLGGVTVSDCKFMSALIKKRTGINIPHEDLVEAALNSPQNMWERYKGGFRHSLINDFKIKVKVNNLNIVTAYE